MLITAVPYREAGTGSSPWGSQRRNSGMFMKFISTYHVTTWLTAFATAIFIYLQVAPANDDSANTVGLYSSIQVYGGYYHSILAVNIVHKDFFHFIFNIFWLVQFGALTERELGWWKTLVLVVVIGFCASTSELLIGGNLRHWT